MKRALLILLCLLFLPLSGAFCLEEHDAASLPHLYTGRIRVSAKVYKEWNVDEGVGYIDIIPKGEWVKIHAVYPHHVLLSTMNGKICGYANRLWIENPRTIDPATTPPYGVEFNHFLAVIGPEPAPITSQPGGGDTLITLYSGAWLSFIGFEEGYAKVIYHRQYGYVDSNRFSSLVPVSYHPEAAGTDHPIASYTSFYKITTDESNLNRIHNLKVACEKMEKIVLKPMDKLNFNDDIGPYRRSEGYLPAGTITEDGLTQGVGGGTCQVSSTLYNVVLQLPGINVLYRRAHGNNGASYLPIWVDAAVGNKTQNFRIRNEYDFPIRFDTCVQDGAITIAMYRAE